MTRTPTAVVAAAFIVGAVVQALSAIPALAHDSMHYQAIALAISDGEVPGDLARRGYLYPLLLALVGGNPEAFAWVQALVMFPLTALFVYLAGREAFSSRVGLVAAVAFIVWLPAAWHTSWLLMETMLAMLMAALAALLAAAVRRTSPRLMIAAGLVAGLLSISHSAYQVLWILAAAAVALLVPPRRFALRFVLGAAIVVLPVWALIAAGAPRLGEPFPVYGYGGAWGFYTGSREETNFSIVPDDFRATELNASNPERLLALVEAGEVQLEPELWAVLRENGKIGERDWYRLGLDNLLASPEAWPAKLAHGLSTMFSLREGMALSDLGSTPAIWGGDELWWMLGLALASFALVGVVLVARRERRFIIVFVPALLQLAFFLVPHTEPRYVVPLWPVMMLAAAYSALLLFGRIRSAISSEHPAVRRATAR